MTAGIDGSATAPMEPVPNVGNFRPPGRGTATSTAWPLGPCRRLSSRSLPFRGNLLRSFELISHQPNYLQNVSMIERELKQFMHSFGETPVLTIEFWRRPRHR